MKAKINHLKVKAKLLLLLAIGLSGQGVWAGNCQGLFYSNTKPIVKNQSLKATLYEFCYTDFAVGYSGVAKVGIWSAEFMSPATLAQAARIKREDNFQEEQRVNQAHNAKLSDYRGSGYDRGHLSPSAQRTSRAAQNDSFFLTNIFPQSSKNNQGSWAEIEKATRSYVKRTKQPVYMVTGTLFLTPNIKKIGNNVLVPTHVYKAVYFSELNIAGAYVSVNDNTNRIDTVSIKQLEQYSGISFFRGLNTQSIYGMRFNLPMNMNDAARKNVVPMRNSVSTIFNMAPNYLSKYGGGNQPQQYISNREVAAELGRGVVNDLKDAGISVIKGMIGNNNK